MALSEERRKQLDTIVQQMETNGESEDDIRFVVEDFKQKYEPEAPKPVEAPERTWGDVGKDILTGEAARRLSVGVGKGAANTAIGLGELVTKIPGVRSLTGGTPEMFAEARRMVAPKGGFERIGSGLEQTAEFIAPGGATARIAAKAPGVVSKIAARSALEGATSAGIAAAQGGDPLTAGAVGAVVPGVLGLAGGAARRFIRTPLDAKAMDSVLRTNLAKYEKLAETAKGKYEKLLNGRGSNKATADAYKHYTRLQHVVDDLKLQTNPGAKAAEYEELTDLVLDSGITGRPADVERIRNFPPIQVPRGAKFDERQAIEAANLKNANLLKSASDKIAGYTPSEASTLYGITQAAIAAGTGGYLAGGPLGLAAGIPVALARWVIRNYPAQAAQILNKLSKAPSALGTGGVSQLVKDDE